MNSESTTLTEGLQSELRRGIDLITQIGDDLFLARPDNIGSIGAHFRHNLDFIVNFVEGLEKGEIDYSTRERELRVETDREYAISMFENTLERLKHIDESSLENEVKIRSEVLSHLWLKSSVARELEFVHSHTVHHYALVASKLRALGVDLPREFGVAPSTLKYWDSIRGDATGA